MDFLPNDDEDNIINEIQEVRNEEYVLIRLTHTMIDKNNIDANRLFRKMLKTYNIVDYDNLKNGAENGALINGELILADNVQDVMLRFYRVNNIRGDCRFSIKKIKEKNVAKIFNIDDLLYISAYKAESGVPRIFIINLTNNIPNKNQIEKSIGFDPIMKKLQEIRPRLREIIQGGFFDNSKGKGNIKPKDVGDTFESLLGVRTNNSSGADLDGLIELKAKGKGTLASLFSMRPQFEGTRIAEYEPNDKKRVSAYTRYYGYFSNAHPDGISLYVTIGVKEHSGNKQGLFLEVDEDNSKIWIMHNTGKKTPEKTAYFTFDDLKQRLLKKHPSTLWISAEKRMQNGIGQFNYTGVEFSRSPRFVMFLSLVKSGAITYDWRGYVSYSEEKAGKNHGNEWRINPKEKAKLFGEISRITF